MPQDPDVRSQRRLAFNEDWAATAVGLALLLFVLSGVVPQGWVP